MTFWYKRTPPTEQMKAFDAYVKDQEMKKAIRETPAKHCALDLEHKRHGAAYPSRPVNKASKLEITRNQYHGGVEE